MRRIVTFLGVTAAGLVAVLAGLAWDVARHAHDPSLAAREGVLTLTNPGHALVGIGIALTGAGLLGSILTLGP